MTSKYVLFTLINIFQMYFLKNYLFLLKIYAFFYAFLVDIYILIFFSRLIRLISLLINFI